MEWVCCSLCRVIEAHPVYLVLVLIDVIHDLLLWLNTSSFLLLTIILKSLIIFTVPLVAFNLYWIVKVTMLQTLLYLVLRLIMLLLTIFHLFIAGSFIFFQFRIFFLQQELNSLFLIGDSERLNLSLFNQKFEYLPKIKLDSKICKFIYYLIPLFSSSDD